MEKILFIGIDLSFNSTGLTFMKSIDNKIDKISFFRIIHDKTSNISKIYEPTPIQNINQITYRMPTNISVSELLIDNKNINNTEQLTTTLQSMICSKRINSVLNSMFLNFTPDKIICSMENYIMPTFNMNRLKTVSGLITLQGYVREFLIRYKIKNSTIDLKLMTPTPSQNKKFFTGNGKADKNEMLKSFQNNYDGNKLIPNTDHGKLDDVIDSFSLMVQGYYEYNKNNKLWK